VTNDPPHVLTVSDDRIDHLSAQERVVLWVRHAEPVVEPSRPPREWGLSDAGRRSAAAIAEALRGSTLDAVVTSDERKAVETGACLAAVFDATVREDCRLREVERPWVDQGFDDEVHRYLRGGAIPGWEPRAEVVRRVCEVLSEVVADKRVAIVTHGTAMTLYLATVAPVDPVEFWCALRMPDVWSVANGRLVRALDGAAFESSDAAPGC
jgi:broad specificity phosphatase PhoE